MTRESQSPSDPWIDPWIAEIRVMAANIKVDKRIREAKGERWFGFGSIALVLEDYLRKIGKIRIRVH